MKWWRQRKDEELDAKIQSHLDMAQRERMERGETHEQARANARREFGNVGLVKEVTRAMWGWAALERYPACGSGNFLHVTLEYLKRPEGEVINALNDFDARQAKVESEGCTIDPHQRLGLEVNPRAAAIADLVLWIGYLQWHVRTRGDATPSEPVLRKFRNIECRDAVLAYDAVEVVTGEDGQPITRWDGRTMNKHPVTGEDAPDETARVPLYAYVNAHKTEWPAADYVVGNPPFIGNKRMRITLGEGYAETLREIQGDVSETVDWVTLVPRFFDGLNTSTMSHFAQGKECLQPKFLKRDLRERARLTRYSMTSSVARSTISCGKSVINNLALHRQRPSVLWSNTSCARMKRAESAAIFSPPGAKSKTSIETQPRYASSLSARSGGLKS